MAGSELVVRIRDSQGNNVDSFGGGGTTANPSVTSERTPVNVNTGQVAVGTTSTLVVAARAGRKSLILTPTSATVYYVGVGANASSTAGLYVAAGATLTLSTEAAVSAAGASALTVTFLETF